LGELALGFLQFEDALFDAVVDGEAVDSYVDGLVEAVDSVDCLFFYELEWVNMCFRNMDSGEEKKEGESGRVGMRGLQDSRTAP
jgi:hypothetical protein